MTEELASLKTEHKDILSNVTEEMASLKTENKDIVQDSVNLVTQQKLERNMCQKVIYMCMEKRQSVRFCLILLHSKVSCKIIWKEIYKIIFQEMNNECILESEKANIFAHA